MDPHMKDEWNSLVEPKALAYPHDALYSGDNKDQIAEDMEKAIAKFLMSQSPIVTTPMSANPKDTRKSNSSHPWYYLVTCISEENLDYLCAEGFISNKHATLHVLHYNPQPSHYIGRICHLTYNGTHRTTVKSVIRNTIYNDTTARNFILEFTAIHNDLIPTTVTAQGEILDWTIRSIRAYHIQNGGNPGKVNSQWKWYIYTPTQDPEHTATWNKSLLSVPINASVHSWGETITDC